MCGPCPDAVGCHAAAGGLAAALRQWTAPPEWNTLPESAQRIRAVWRLPSTAGEKEAARCEHAPPATQVTDFCAWVPPPRDPPPSRDPRAPPPPAVVPWLALDDAADAWAGSLAVMQATTPPGTPPARGATNGLPEPPAVAAAPRQAAPADSQHAVVQGVPLGHQPQLDTATTGTQPFQSGAPPGLHKTAAVPQVQTVLSKTPRMSPPRPVPPVEAALLSHARKTGSIAATRLQSGPRPMSAPSVHMKPRPQPAAARGLQNHPSRPGQTLNSPQLWTSHPQQQRHLRLERTTHPPPDTVMNTARPHPVTLVARGLHPAGDPQPVTQHAAGEMQPRQGAAHSTVHSANRNSQPTPLPPPPAPPPQSASAPAHGPPRTRSPHPAPRRSAAAHAGSEPSRRRSESAGAGAMPGGAASGAAARQHAARPAAHTAVGPRVVPVALPRPNVAAQPPRAPPELGRRTMNIGAIHGGGPRAAPRAGSAAGTKRPARGGAAAPDVAEPVPKRSREDEAAPTPSDTVSDLPRTRSAEAVTSGTTASPLCCDRLQSAPVAILIIRSVWLLPFAHLLARVRACWDVLPGGACVARCVLSLYTTEAD